jgi:hypothetical protein
VDSTRVVCPLFQAEDGGSIPASTLQVKDLLFEPSPRPHAVQLVREWHSRLPNCQDGPWEYAFLARYGRLTYAVALLNSPSARCLPSHWLELRRLACAPDAPKNTCSAFLGWIVRYLKAHASERERLISYQDTAVHAGTIYRAAGWIPAFTSAPRIRDRSGNRTGTKRKYRWNINGQDADAAAKVRWEISLTRVKPQTPAMR